MQMRSPLRMLMLTHAVPFPIREGGQVYTANIIRTLSERDDVELAVIAIGQPEAQTELPPRARWSLARSSSLGGIVRGILGRYPRSTAATRTRTFRRALNRMLTSSEWDVVIFDYIAIGWTLPIVQRKTQGSRALLVYISHNVESILRPMIADGVVGSRMLRLLARRDARKAAKLEASLVSAADLVTAETEEDVLVFRSLFPSATLHRYTPGYAGNIEDVRAVPLIDSSRAVTVIGSRNGIMKRLVLDEFLRTASNALAAIGVGVVVAGDAPDSYLRALRSEYPEVDFRGYVEDLPGLLSASRLAVVNDHIGGGFKHRVLTLVFNRVPIAAAPEAMAGLPLDAGVHYLAIGPDGDLPELVGDVIDDFDRLELLQRAAFDVCREAFSWDRQTEEFVEALSAQHQAE